MNQGLGLRWAQLTATALVVGAVSWIGWRIYLNNGALLSPASWVSSVLLFVLGVLVVGAGLPVRRFLRGEATKSLSPIRAARTLVLGQAAALTGAGVLGWYAAQALHALTELSLPGYRDVFWRLFTLCTAAVFLAAAGMLTQRMCRIDPPGDSSKDA